MPLAPEQRQAITFANIDFKDCGVAALMAVTGWPRDKALPLLATCGYDPDSGTTRGGIEAALTEGGLEHVQLDPSSWAGDTPATFTMTHEEGLYVLYVHKHVMGLVDGDLYNGGSSWRMPLDDVTHVLR